MTEITFAKVTFQYKETIFSWLAEPHIQEFWDNTQAHKDDIIHFMEGRKRPSSYGDGQYIYWIASCKGEPYAMLMTIQETPESDIGQLKLSHISKTGHTYGIDYMIGNPRYLGQGYGARTLIEFIDYFCKNFDEKADTFLIDPAIDNPRAKHVYEKAGFKYMADFVMSGDCSGSGKPHHLLVKKIPPQLEEQDFVVVEWKEDDINAINQLSRLKRKNYEKAQPIFWKWAGETGEKMQRNWFKKLLSCENYIGLTAKNSHKVKGFIIGKIIEAPEVYRPGGPTLMIDDFCVADGDWDKIGGALIAKIKSIAKDRGVVQMVVVSGSHDHSKKMFLKKMGLLSASEWFVGDVL